MEDKKERISYTFRELINGYIEDRFPVNSNRQLIDTLNSSNVTLSMRMLQMIRKGNKVPSYFMAKEILKGLGVEMSDDDLVDVIANSKKEIGEIKNRQYVSRNESNGIYYRAEEKTDLDEPQIKVALNISEIEVEGIEPFMVESILNQRIDELYNEDKTTVRYIKDLIKYDLEHNVLKGDK